MKKKLSIIGIIPARYQSSRFVGKPLAPILGKSLIQRTYEQALQCSSFDKLFVATDDERIFSHVKSFGGNVLMTSANCSNGTERAVDALEQNKELQNADIVINIQGDHPCITPETIEKIIQELSNDKDAVMSTAASPIKNVKEALSCHVVKCVFDKQGNALYFSRACIPHLSYLPKATKLFSHVGIYAYRTKFLLSLPKLKNTHLQEIEDLEQLKVLEHGFRIKVAVVNEPNLGVDVFEDIEKVEKFLCQ